MTTFVGRAQECATLEQYAAQARSGQPRVVIVEGEAGSGKSTLLAHFTAGLADAHTLRASGDEAEQHLTYGVLSQFAAAVVTEASLQSVGSGLSFPADGLPSGVGAPHSGISHRIGSFPDSLPCGAALDRADPLLAGSDLIALLGAEQRPGKLLVLVTDDLHLADRPSAQALLFAFRRLRWDRVLALVSVRPGTLGRLGEGWVRFASGDHRAARLRVNGFGADDLLELGRALGAGNVTERAIRNLMRYGGGNPLYCRMLIEELGGEGLDQPEQDVRIPQALAELIAPKVAALRPAARTLLNVAAVLGRECGLTEAGCLSALGTALPAALAEARDSGLLHETTLTSGSRISFPHTLIHRIVYDSLSPPVRHRLHAEAASMLGGEQSLAHRFAIATAPDDALARDLEAAAGSAQATGRVAEAASWLTQASELSTSRDQRDLRLLDAVEILVGAGDAAGAQALLPGLIRAAPSGRRTALLGYLDLMAGRAAAAETRLLDAWRRRDPGELSLAAMVASQLTQQYLADGRTEEAIDWARRYVESAQGDAAESARAHGLLAFSLIVGGHRDEGQAALDILPTAPADLPLSFTDALALRGVFRLFADELHEAVADLSTAAARLRAGAPLLFGCQTLSYLADATYRLGLWDESVVYGELAVSLAHDTEANWGLGFVHAAAALVPAVRGEWPVARAHTSAACDAALAQGAGSAIATAATARAVLAAAEQDFEEVLLAVSMVRATGRAEALSLPAHFEWPVLEIDAYIALDKISHARAALTVMEASLREDSPASAKVDAARLRGNLAIASGDADESEQWFAAAWHHAQSLARPLQLARLEIDDSRRLRRAGRRPAAIRRLRSARQRLASLGARPYVEICDRELAACGASVRAGRLPQALGLTPAELSVARLVASGLSNRETAAELYVSVKTVEYHLSHIYAKLGIHSRMALAERMAMPRV